MEKPDAVPAMTCAEDNKDAFRSAFREAVGEEGRALAKALFDAGLINGLRGARIRPAGADRRPGEVGVCPVLSDAAESRLADRWWQRAQESNGGGA